MRVVVAADVDVKEIEVFRSGIHTSSNGTTLSFTQDHLQQIADSYDPSHHEAPVIVGHAYGTSPAYGWVDSLKVTGDRLVARVKQIEPQFAELVRQARFKKISAGLYQPDSPSNPYPGKFSLREVSFLGAQPPAIKGLKPVEFAEEEGVLTFDESLDFMSDRFSITLFQRLRDYLIDKESLETADKIIPADYLQMLSENTNRPDYEYQRLSEMLDAIMMRVTAIEARDGTAISLLPQNTSYTESIDFAASKMFGQSKKKKNCTKGTSCGNGCISATKTCRKKAAPEQKEAIKKLKNSPATTSGDSSESLGKNPLTQISISNSSPKSKESIEQQLKSGGYSKIEIESISSEISKLSDQGLEGEFKKALLQPKDADDVRRGWTDRGTYILKEAKKDNKTDKDVKELVSLASEQGMYRAKSPMGKVANSALSQAYEDGSDRHKNIMAASLGDKGLNNKEPSILEKKLRERYKKLEESGEIFDYE